VLELARGEDLLGPLSPGQVPIEAEAVYCARAEMVTHLSDLLSRRTRLALIDAAAGLGERARATEVLAGELGWSERERLRQVSAHRTEVETERGLALHPGRRSVENPATAAETG
jgi:glycerol-3-phosphate dehydrogenase